MPPNDDIEPVEKRIDGVEKRLDEQINGLNVKIDGVQKTVDQKAQARTGFRLPRRVHDLEEKVFGQPNHPKHLSL